MNIALITSHDSNRAEKVKAAFQAVLTVHGDTPAQRVEARHWRRVYRRTTGQHTGGSTSQFCDLTPAAA
jgi:hypothetical protein